LLANLVGQVVVVKEAYLGAMGAWDEQLHWLGNIEDRIPKEAAFLREVSWLLDARNSVMLYRSYAVYGDRRMYRVYTELCPHGNLEDLINEHRPGVDEDGEVLLM